jgi:hypothetical protein
VDDSDDDIEHLGDPNCPRCVNRMEPTATSRLCPTCGLSAAWPLNTGASLGTESSRRVAVTATLRTLAMLYPPIEVREAEPSLRYIHRMSTELAGPAT